MENKNMAAHKSTREHRTERIVTSLSAERIGQMKAAAKVT